MKSFWYYYRGAVARPRRTFDELMADPRRLHYGFLAVLLTAFLYTLVYLFLSAQAHELAMNTATPWRTLLWCLFAVYFAWFPIVCCKGVGAAQRLPKGPAIVLGIVSFVVFQAFFVLFNR